MKIAVWLKGLAAALIGGAVSSAAQAAAGGDLRPSQLKGAAIAGAILTLGAYLTRSPIAGSTKTEPPPGS
jgi:hypothetical protein